MYKRQLSPNVSLGIIIGHVRDGMTLAREHHLPPTLLQFIQQHHGTTLVEYFYNEACRKQAGSEADVYKRQLLFIVESSDSRAYLAASSSDVRSN